MDSDADGFCGALATLPVREISPDVALVAAGLPRSFTRDEVAD